MSDARSPLDDELISAYLDDELSDDERQGIEKLLADRDDYRQAVEELTAIRRAVQSLPAYELADDFPVRVLRRAERAMLTANAGPADELPAASVPSTAEMKRSWPLRWSVMAAVAAMAATLLFVLVAIPRGQQVNLVRQAEQPALPDRVPEVALPSERTATDLSETWTRRRTAMETTASRQGGEQPAQLAKSAARPAYRDVTPDSDLEPARELASSLPAGTREDMRGGIGGAELGRSSVLSKGDKQEIAANDRRQNVDQLSLDQSALMEPLAVDKVDLIVEFQMDKRSQQSALIAALARNDITLSTAAGVLAEPDPVLGRGRGSTLTTLALPDVDDPGQARGVQPTGDRLSARESVSADSQLVYVEASLPQVQGMLRQLKGSATRTAVLQAAVIPPSGEELPSVEELHRRATKPSLFRPQYPARSTRDSGVDARAATDEEETLADVPRTRAAGRAGKPELGESIVQDSSATSPPRGQLSQRARERSAAGSGVARSGRAAWVRPVLTDGMREGDLPRPRAAEADERAITLRSKSERKAVVGGRVEDVADPAVDDVAIRNEAAKEYYFGQQLGISPAGPAPATPVRVLIVLNDVPAVRDPRTTPAADGGREAAERSEQPEDVD